MPAFATAYLGSALAMLVMDVIWLTTMVPLIYRPALGDMLADPPNLWVAAVFYLVYLIGVVVFAVLPALSQQNWLMALALAPCSASSPMAPTISPTCRRSRTGPSR